MCFDEEKRYTILCFTKNNQTVSQIDIGSFELSLDV